MMGYNLAIVGVTGLVGRSFLEVLEERKHSFDNCFFYASAKSVGKRILFNGKEYEVLALTANNIKGKKIDVALFSAGGKISEKYAPLFVREGAVVIDNSSKWRMNENVPLIVPEINEEDIGYSKGIIANPNCSTIQASICLKPLDDMFKLKRVVISTYQAVSGAGMQGILDLEGFSDGIKPKKLPRQIAYNVIPQIDQFTPSGYTVEEVKMINELRKILHKPNLSVTATCVRVPVFYGHSEAISVEFEKTPSLDEVINCLMKFPSIVLSNENEYYTPIDIVGRDEVFVSRVRQDMSVKGGFSFFAVADNLRKGASANAVQILELLKKKSNR